MTVEVTIADQKFKKNVAFKYGSKPYTSLVCAGLEEGIVGMRVGGRRKLTIPLELGPAGINLLVSTYFSTSEPVISLSYSLYIYVCMYIYIYICTSSF
jgi:hypothetical protein